MEIPPCTAHTLFSMILKLQGIAHGASSLSPTIVVHGMLERLCLSTCTQTNLEGGRKLKPGWLSSRISHKKTAL